MRVGTVRTALRAALAAGWAIFFLASGPVAQAGIIVSWTGTVSVFNFGPYSGGETVSSSFVLDDTVVATGSPNKTFALAADSMSLDVAGDGFTGEDGRLVQYSTSTDFFVVDFVTGILGGTSFNGYELSAYGFEIRGAAGDLFADPATMAAGLTEADISYSNISLRFDDPLTAPNENLYAKVFLSTLSISGTPAAVPEPAALGLLGVGLAGIGGAMRRRNRAGRRGVSGRSAPAFPR